MVDSVLILPRVTNFLLCFNVFFNFSYSSISFLTLCGLNWLLCSMILTANL